MITLIFGPREGKLIINWTACFRNKLKKRKVRQEHVKLVRVMIPLLPFCLSHIVEYQDLQDILSSALPPQHSIQ